MIRTIPLIIANLKGFVRNWQSITLLLIFPLLLVGLVFVSFNPEGLRDVPVGVVVDTDSSLSIGEIKEVFPYLEITEHAVLDDCLTELKRAN